jgi:hypothetical protein
MRNPILGLILTAALAGPAVAQQAPVKILRANIGLPPGRFVGERDDNGQAAHVVKNNTWAPVYVDLEIVKETKRKAAIVVETKETDDLIYTVTAPLPDLSSLQPGTVLRSVELPRMPYLRPNGREEVTVTIAVPDTGDPSSWRKLSEPARVKYVAVRDVSKYVVLSLGTNLPGFDLPKENVGDNQFEGGRALRNGRIETAAITEVAQMPDKWFGYESADLVILTTGAVNQGFLDSLFQDPTYRPRLDALMEWVRRGGRLVVSVGQNAGLVVGYPALTEILPAQINAKDQFADVNEIKLEMQIGNRRSSSGFLQPRAGAKLRVANLVAKPGQGFRTLIPPPAAPGTDDASLNRKVMVQSGYGLGRVTLVAFDLDRSPFLDLEAEPRAIFWDNLLKEAGAAKASSSKGNARNPNPYGGYNYYAGDTEDEQAGGIRTHIDTFEGVPVISFGWVAVFILLYTLLIGPVEYLILKKVFKRLELTWITFPIIVLTVSAIAYFTAYALKGDDLKINKMDLVDVDPASGRVYGHTWFTIFSPRIETYTVTTEPGDGWAAAGVEQPAPLVDGFGGAKSGRGGLFSRRFQFHCDPDTGALADGMVGVPIQVWSTKAFESDWSARTDRATPLVQSKLFHPPAKREDVAGTFTLNLPIKELKDVWLIYAGKPYKYDNPITPGATVNVLLGKPDDEWQRAWGQGAVTAAPQQMGVGRRPASTPTGFAPMSLLSVMFHEATFRGTEDANAVLSNATVRRIDQSWRLSDEHRDEVIVIGRTDAAADSAEALMSGENPFSPTKLWLKALPGTGVKREPIPGTLRQETYVRIFVPVEPAKK